MILLDANILVSAVLGTRVRREMAAAHARGVALAATERQIVEAAQVLVDKVGLLQTDARRALTAVAALLTPVGSELYAGFEAAARSRLHDRAQSDWPILAAALASGAGIWSEDRDLFGTGVAVWSSRNVQFTE